MRRKPLVYLYLSIIASLLGVGLMLLLRAPGSQAAPGPQASLPDLAIFKYRVDKCPRVNPDAPRDPIPPFAPGQEIAYEIYFENRGNQVAGDVRIVAAIPNWTTYVNSSGPGFKLVQAGPDQVVWLRAGLASYERGWLCLTVRVDADAPVGARVENRAHILILDPESDYKNNQLTLVDHILPAEADLTVMSDLHPNSDTPAPGGRLTYRIATLNKGGATAHNLVITDTLPLSATFVSESHPVGFTTQITGRTVVWTAPSMAGNYPAKDLTPSDQDISLTVHLSSGFDPAAHWLENVVEISTADPEYSTANNLNRFTLKPEADQLYAAAVASVDDRTMQLLQDGGYDWMVYYLDWSHAEPSEGQYNWDYLHDAIWKAWQYHLKLVVRVGRAPAWARSNPDPTAPPDDPDDLRDFMQALAASSVTQIAGYIIWNEPNLAAEWGGDPPSAAAYTALLQAAYNGVQAGDPDAFVISAGLAPTNGDLPTAVDDRTFLQDMYTAGAGSHFDMLGVNPLGFASAPDDTADPNHYHFARALEWRAIMEANGDSGKQMFAAEMGWLRDTQNDLGGHNWMKVSEIDQAHYLARAYHKARCEMPWMGPMSTWNLDFAGFYADTEHLHWYAVTDQNRDPLRAYLTLQNAATLGPADLWVALEQIDPIVHGQNFRYRLRYTNVGGQTAAGVMLTDTLPAGTEYVGDTGGGTPDGDQIVWDLGDVDLCAYQTITLTARLSGSGWPGGPLINTLEASTVPGEPYTDDNLAQVTNPVVAELAIQKSISLAATRPGQTVSYTLTYRNSGQINATGVRITDVLPITLTTISHSSAGALITPTGSVSYTWQVAELAPGEGGVITITGIVSPAVSGVSSFANQATIATGAVEASLDNNTSTVSLTVDDEPPDPPTLQGPADNSRINDNTPTLTWTASPSSDVAGYLLGLDWGVLDMGDALQYTSAVLPDGTHAWTVAAYDLAGNTGMITATWSFTVDTEPPDPPTLLSPADNLRTGDNTPTLIWSASPSPDAVGYLLDLAGMLVDVGNTTRYTSSVLMDGTYTWTVAAYDGAGNIGTYAAVWSFTAEPYHSYLPLVARNYGVAPDLVVDRIVATSNEVQVGIKNVGNAAVMDGF